jgi:co-chaperonin GroES (HSP10)
VTTDALRLRPDLVLVALPPRTERVRASGLVTLDASDRADMLGKVRLVGAAVREVCAGQFVVFGRLAGQPVDVDGHPHLLIREADLDAVVEP